VPATAEVGAEVLRLATPGGVEAAGVHAALAPGKAPASLPKETHPASLAPVVADVDCEALSCAGAGSARGVLKEVGKTLEGGGAGVGGLELDQPERSCSRGDEEERGVTARPARGSRGDETDRALMLDRGSSEAGVGGSRSIK
jgi:hypothetical protein